MHFIFLATESSVPVISLSDLEFGEILGEGGQGVVHKGRWISKDVDVAIKKITGRVNEREVSLTAVLCKALLHTVTKVSCSHCKETAKKCIYIAGLLNR